MKELLEQAIELGKEEIPLGEVASYIPELANADVKKIGIAIQDMQGNMETCGDVDNEFTMQSIVKVAIYALALEDLGLRRVLEKVGVKPSADAFNSIVKLEDDSNHRPLNPFINAGAIMCTAILKGSIDKRRHRVIELLQKLFNRDNVQIDIDTYLSEKATGDRNRALAYMMKGTGIMDSDIDVEKVLDLYFQLCSVKVTVKDLANMAAVLANDGVSPITGEQILSLKVNRVVLTVMFTCGLYDYSGEFAVRVALPAKSGVGGGILAASKGKYGIAVANPALDIHGNSIAGVRMLEYISDKLDLETF
ncbi:MAG: glutaminase A [Tissierellia bacterium]|nr:glutaminase A [Tissierellia bacterium]